MLDNMLSARAIEAVPSVGLKVPVGRIWSPKRKQLNSYEQCGMFHH